MMKASIPAFLSSLFGAMNVFALVTSKYGPSHGFCLAATMFIVCVKLDRIADAAERKS